MRALRADEWLMMGVVGLGAFAAYRLLRAPGNAVAPLPVGPPSPASLGMGTMPVTPPMTPPSMTPTTPLSPSPIAGVLQPPAGLTVFSGSSIPLPMAGLGVQGRIETDPPGLLSSASSDAAIAQQITIALGLDNVSVYDTPALAAALGQPWALQSPNPGSRWFWGRVPPGFSGRTVVRPPFLALAWIAGPPAAVTTPATSSAPIRDNLAALR